MLLGTHLLRGETGWRRAGSAQDLGPVPLECGGGGGADTESDCWALKPDSEPALLRFSEGGTALIIRKGCWDSLQGVVREAEWKGRLLQSGQEVLVTVEVVGVEQSLGGRMGEASDRWPGEELRGAVWIKEQRLAEWI